MTQISKEELNSDLNTKIEAGSAASAGLMAHLAGDKHIASVGTNANGTYVAYESGLLICTHTLSKVIPDATGKLTGTWVSPYPYTDGLPRPFFDVSVSYNYYYGDTDVPQNMLLGKVTGGLTSMLLNYVLKFETTSAPYEKDLSFFLVGRWK